MGGPFAENSEVGPDESPQLGVGIRSTEHVKEARKRIEAEAQPIAVSAATAVAKKPKPKVT